MFWHWYWLQILKSPAISALIGGLVGILGGYLVNFLTFKRDKEERAKATLEAIRAEIRSIVGLMEEADYEKALREGAKKIEETKQPSFLKIPVQIDLFTKVYSANVTNLGVLDISYLPDIVSFYATIHGLTMDLEHLKPQPFYPELADNQLKIYKFDAERVVRTIALGKRILQS